MDEQLWLTRSRLVRIKDGDTYILISDLGRGLTHTETIRLKGVDAPELGTAASVEAKLWVLGWFATAGGLVSPDTWPLYVRTYQVRGRYEEYTDRSGARYVADVYDRTGQSLADALVAAGHAVPWKKA